MAELDRKTRLCQQAAPPAMTGIDFVQVVDHTLQDRLHVFFIVEPQLLMEPPPAPPATPSIPEAGALAAADTSGMSIVAPSTGEEIEIVSANWVSVTVNGVARRVLEINLPGPGSDAIFEFRYAHPAVDRFFSAEPFTFKQGCPTGLDCKTTHQCPDRELKDVDIDYLARDFGSLRAALLDFAAAHYPEWEARIEADQAMMLLEIMAALGDEFAYQQDRYALEGYLETATQKRSVTALARLVDYEADYGQSATTEVAIGVSGPARYTIVSDPTLADVPDRAYAVREGLGAITFEAIEGVWVHPDWNQAQLHLPDSAHKCLEIGATEAYLRIAPPDGTDPTTTPSGVALTNPEDVWVGRRIILRSGVGAADEPNRAWIVHPLTVSAYTDPLDPGAGTLTHITWDRSEALPFEMPIEFASAYLNTARVIAGRTVRETFRVGADSEIETRFPGADAYQTRQLLDLPRAVERAGACERGVRGRVLRHGLSGSDSHGLAWDGPVGDAAPVMSLFEIEPDLGTPNAIAFEPGPASQQWSFVESILDADPADHAFTVEHGLWREIVRFQKPAGDVVLNDYASDAGFTVRFGDRDFGISPADGTILQAIYLTAPGIDANLPADTVNRLTDPADIAAMPGMAGVDWVTNPFAIDSARAAESVDRIRLNAPEAYKAILLRAVRNQDYRQILERRADIQQANANTRWTGSWPTDFIAVDPVDVNELSADLRTSLESEIDCIRQAGRSVCLRDPDYVPIDVKIDVCLDPGASNAATLRRITRRLTQGALEDNYFHPDNFSFGDSLIRSDLEAAVQCVDGVRGVEAIEYRRRGWHDFETMPARVETAPHQILQLSNDPARPERGYLEVSVHGGG
jgi:hypothetical protein